MELTKSNLLKCFRNEMDKFILTLPKSTTTANKKSNAGKVNKYVKKLRDDLISSATKEIKDKEILLEKILLIQYVTYVIMLEYRNIVWEYEYMAFSRRIGEIWEEFCKIPFDFPAEDIEIFEPIDFNSIRNNDTSRFTVISKNQKEIYDNPSHSFFLSEKNDVINIINNAETTLGDICSCVTGIYVGNNTKYIEVISEDTKNSKGYTVVDSNKINNDYMNEDILSGLEGEQTYIPIVKGASNDRYIRSSYPWYVNWSKEAIKEYNTNKKARFQNSQFYFKKGIVVPMIKSSKFRATLIDNMVFDQSVVGVFPNEEIYVLYILAFLNSDVARDLIQVINPSANNSANYVKKIPVILPSEEGLEYVNGKVGNILTLINTGSNEDIESYQEEINQFFNELYYK